jgi:hypothetical protein
LGSLWEEVTEPALPRQTSFTLRLVDGAAPFRRRLPLGVAGPTMIDLDLPGPLTR